MSSVAIMLSEAELEALIDKRVEAKLAAAGATASATKTVLNTAEVAELLGKHPKTIRKLVLERGLPVTRSSGKEPRYIRAEVMKWLESSREET